MRGETNSAPTGGGLKVIASGSQSLEDPVNVTLPQPASFLLFQEWHTMNYNNQVMQSSGVLMPGDAVTVSSAASTKTLVSFTGTEFYYAKETYDSDEYTLKYIALG